MFRVSSVVEQWTVNPLVVCSNHTPGVSVSFVTCSLSVVGWILKLDGGSKNILAAAMRPDGSMGIDEIEIETEKSFDGDLQQCIGRRVILRDAESAHHHTPLLLSACKLLTVPQSQFQKENTREAVCQNLK